MSDIVEKLHEYARCAETRYEIEMCDEAIKEITRMREALGPFATAGNACSRSAPDHYCCQILVGDLRKAAAAIREGGQDAADLWRHVKTGGVYEIVGECIIEATNKPAVLYRSVIAVPGISVWTRPKDEFFDGRFEKVEREAGGREG